MDIPYGYTVSYKTLKSKSVSNFLLLDTFANQKYVKKDGIGISSEFPAIESCVISATKP